MKRVVKQSKRAAFYNEGPVVFLYDKSFAESIRESGADVLDGYDETCADDPVLESLAGRGELLLYELFQDDEVEIEVLVSDKLTPDVRDRLSSHLRLPVGWIRLPSGKLFLDSYNTLRAGPEEPVDPGATVDVPAGIYSVAVYRNDDEQTDYPHDVIVLRPLKRKPTGQRPAILKEEVTIQQAAGDRVGYGKVTGGVFVGLIRFVSGTDLFAVNMGPEAAEALGLEAGSTLSFEIGDSDVTIPGVYMGDTMDEYRKALSMAEKLENSAEEMARVSWGARDDFDGLLLVCTRTRRQANVPESFFGRWTPVRVV